MKIGKDKGENQGTHPSRAKVFKRLLQSGMNKSDADAVETKVWLQHDQRLVNQWDPMLVSKIKGPQTSPLYLSQLGRH